MDEVTLRPTSCAICQTTENVLELHPANFSAEAFDPAIFSARRLPDRIHYRMVRCRECGLVRSDPSADPGVLAALYRQSTFDYSGEIPNLQRTYGRYLARLDRHGAKKGALLEIGCGNGFFLEQALRQGYADARGIEPSEHAISQASAGVAGKIVCDVMRPGVFPPGTFDVVCLFQVFDHLPDPAAVLAECRNVLRPGGLILILNHNIEALSARALGEKSPIIDIEHTYLFSPATLGKLAAKQGFSPLESGAVWNDYTLQYFCRLLPMRGSWKRAGQEFLRRSGLGRLPLSVPIGNLFFIAKTDE